MHKRTKRQTVAIRQVRLGRLAMFCRAMKFGACSIVFAACGLADQSTAFAQDNNGVAQQLQQMKAEMDRLSQQMQKSKIGGFQLETQEKIESQLSLMVRQFSSGQQSKQTADESQSESQSGTSTGQGTGGADPEDEANSEQPPPPATQREFILKAWGLMPEQLRKDNSSGITPSFLPGYERAIQKYYERIAR